jgi:hypothetical protein
MNHLCPHCGANLAQLRPAKIPEKGETSVLALRWHLQCPSCLGLLKENQHPFDKAVAPGLMAAIGILNFACYLLNFRASLSTLVATVALMIVGLIISRRAVIPKEWTKYLAYSPPKF